MGRHGVFSGCGSKVRAIPCGNLARFSAVTTTPLLVILDFSSAASRACIPAKVVLSAFAPAFGVGDHQSLPVSQWKNDQVMFFGTAYWR